MDQSPYFFYLKDTINNHSLFTRFAAQPTKNVFSVAGFRDLWHPRHQPRSMGLPQCSYWTVASGAMAQSHPAPAAIYAGGAFASWQTGSLGMVRPEISAVKFGELFPLPPSFEIWPQRKKAGSGSVCVGSVGAGWQLPLHSLLRLQNPLS